MVPAGRSTLLQHRLAERDVCGIKNLCSVQATWWSRRPLDGNEARQVHVMKCNA